MLWRRSVRGAVVPALAIGGALFAASGLTYAVVHHLPQQVAARSAAAGPPRTGPSQLAPLAGQSGPRSPRASAGRTPSVTPAAPRSLQPSSPGLLPSQPPASPGQARSGQGPKVTPGPTLRPGTGPQTAGRGTEQSELAGLAVVLERSAASRTAVVDAARGVVNCTLGPGPGLAELTSAIAARQEELGLTLSLPVSAIPVGGQLRAELAAALRLSIAADRSLARWMKDARQTGGCPAAPLASDMYRAALRASSLATQEKQQFLRLWDPLAARFGQPVYTGSQI